MLDPVAIECCCRLFVFSPINLSAPLSTLNAISALPDCAYNYCICWDISSPFMQLHLSKLAFYYLDYNISILTEHSTFFGLGFLNYANVCTELSYRP